MGIIANWQTDIDNNILLTSCAHDLFNQILSAAGQIVRLGLLALKHRMTCFNMIARWPD